MSVRTSESDACTCHIQNDAHCGHANDNNSSPPMKLVNDDVTSCTCIQSGDNDLGHPSNNSPSRLVHLNGDGISCTSIQDDPGSPNNNPPFPPVRLDGDAIQDDPGSQNNNPPSHPILRYATATSCKCQNHDHYRIPCGCPSEDSHDMHKNGARHHHWCSQCIRYCYRDSVCDKPLKILPPFTLAISNGRDL